MARGSKYTDDFAAQIMAQCDLSTDLGKVLKQHAIPRRTHTNWEARARKDVRFAELCQEKRKVLEKEWKRYAVSSLRAAFKKAQTLIEACTQPSDLEHLNDFIRTVGDLAVSIEVLDDEQEPKTQSAQA